jgi:hypothetical protein
LHRSRHPVLVLDDQQSHRPRVDPAGPATAKL